MKCFRCLQPGNKSNECPSRHQAQLLEGNEEAEPVELEAVLEEEIEELLADDGEPIVCVMEKWLIAPRKPIDIQRHRLFHSKCTINRKVFVLVIDIVDAQRT